MNVVAESFGKVLARSLNPLDKISTLPDTAASALDVFAVNSGVLLLYVPLDVSKIDQLLVVEVRLNTIHLGRIPV